jgi:hypothetical protein
MVTLWSPTRPEFINKMKPFLVAMQGRLQPRRQARLHASYMHHRQRRRAAAVAAAAAAEEEEEEETVETVGWWFCGWWMLVEVVVVGWRCCRELHVAGAVVRLRLRTR